jgi:hypothetical protein
LGLQAFSQQQNVSGLVLNSFTERPIADVKVQLLLNDSIIASSFTSEEGEFLFVNIPLAIYDISFAHVEYEAFILPDITLVSGRSDKIQVELIEAFKQLDEFTITPHKDRSKNNNEMVTNSVKTIYLQDMQKLAGSLDDPIRVAGMMPGVTSDAAFSENFISIRGNSPRGLKYQMEGVEVINPSHFARIGSSGGTFTVFSMQLLDKSDFFTGAFPAEYSNALSGVMDVNFRRGNQATKEYSITAGTLGLDFSTEGPFNEKMKSSYLVNYRYSVVGLARLIGYPTQPTYQDLSFVLNFPQKNGELKVFGIGGTSDRKRLATADSTLWEADLDRYNLSLRSEMLMIGATYDRRFGENTLMKVTTVGNAFRQIDNRNYLLDNYAEIIRSKNEYNSMPLTAAVSVKHKFSRRHTNKTGGSFEYATHNWDVLRYNFESSILDTNVIGTGQSHTAKAYTQSRFFITEKLVANVGVSSLYYSVNNKYSIEPRIGLSYKTKGNGRLSLALGRHSQIEHFATYLYQNKDSLGNTNFPNKSLDFVKAYHAIGGFKTTIFKNHYFNVEVYYQYLYNIPTEQNGTFSMANIAELENVRPLVNIGTGENYGIDFGLERYANKGLYYMINASIFESSYVDGLGVRRSTEFDQKFNVKFLAGKEYIVGEKKGKINFLGWNTNVSYVGGRPYTPVDLAASETNQETVLNEQLAYSLREKNLLFADVTFTYKINKPKRTIMWSLQIKNIFSNGAAIYREYDPMTQQETTVKSSSFFPNLSYKIQF